jgi:SAM-dependent methyltransferase
VSRGKTLPESNVLSTGPRIGPAYPLKTQLTGIAVQVPGKLYEPPRRDPAAFARDRVPGVPKTEDDIEFLKNVYRWENDDEHLWDRQCDGVPKEAFYKHGQTLLSLLEPKITEDGLNLGCGAGRVEEQWASKCRTLTGTDFSFTMIEKARRHVSWVNTRFVPNDGKTLPFSDGLFDFAWCELVFQHVPKSITLGYIREVRRVLRPGGRFVCQIPRVEVYGDDRVCGGMTLAEVFDAFPQSEWSKLDFPSNAWRPEYYFTPLAIK